MSPDAKPILFADGAHFFPQPHWMNPGYIPLIGHVKENHDALDQPGSGALATNAHDSAHSGGSSEVTDAA